jgi:WD40 repeat protein
MIKNGVDTLFFSPDSRRLASGAFGEVCMWEVASGERQSLWAAQGSVAMAADFRTVAVADNKADVLRLFDPETGKRLHQLVGYRSWGLSDLETALAIINSRDFREERLPVFSADGRRLMTGSLRGPVEQIRSVICLWDVDTGNKLATEFSRLEFAPHGLTISPDGGLLAALRSDLKMCLFSTNSGNVIRMLGETEESMCPTPAFTPDGRLLITATKRSVQFWEVATGGEIARHPAHRDDVRELVVSANGRCLATTSWDHAILIWDLARLATDDRPRGVVLAATEFPALWSDLASPDAKKGRRAVETLIAAPQQAVPMLRERVQPATMPDAKKLVASIADLGSDDFDRRQEAEQELHRLGELATPALQKSLAANPSLEARRRIEGLLKKLKATDLTAEALRGVRVVQVLESIGTQQARAMLQVLAGGAAASRQTQDAKASLRRLGLGTAASTP